MSPVHADNFVQSCLEYASPYLSLSACGRLHLREQTSSQQSGPCLFCSEMHLLASSVHLPCLPKRCSTRQQCFITVAAESAILRCEAFSALHGVAKNYFAALALGWDAVRHAVELTVKAERLTGSGSRPALPSMLMSCPAAQIPCGLYSACVAGSDKPT